MSFSIHERIVLLHRSVVASRCMATLLSLFLSRRTMAWSISSKENWTTYGRLGPRYRAISTRDRLEKKEKKDRRGQIPFYSQLIEPPRDRVDQFKSQMSSNIGTAYSFETRELYRCYRENRDWIVCRGRTVARFFESFVWTELDSRLVEREVWQI